jgi:ABC-2 type transport system ATP-binding protein
MSEIPPTPAIEIRGLTKFYKTQAALRSLDMKVERGDLYGFVGANGAGKTTTLKILATLLRPNGGSVYVLGFNVLTQPHEIRKRIGYMPDFFGVYQDMETWEYLDFFGAAYRMLPAERDKRIADVLELVGLTQKKENLIAELSRGMQQRLGLARVLMHDPELLLLDEPASGLDPRARMEIMAILQELQKMGKTVLISSHILPELQQLCDKVGIIEKGQMVYNGPMLGLPTHGGPSRNGEAVVFDRTAEAVDALSADPRVEKATEENGHIRFILKEDANISVVAEVLTQKGFKIRMLKELSAGLEDVFMNLTSAELEPERSAPPPLIVNK